MTHRVMIEDTLLFYRCIMEDLGMVVDEDGFAYYEFTGPDDRAPVMVNERHVFLPTKERLKNIDSAHTIAFHPLCQNVLRDNSLMFLAIKKYVTLELTKTIHILLRNLAELALDTKLHDQLTPRQAAFLQHVTDFKKRTYQTLKQLTKLSNYEDRDKALLSMYVRKGGTVGSKQYSQACIVNFPLRQLMEKAQGVEVGDAKFYSHKDKEAAEHLFDYLLPDWKNYSQGSTSSVAPNLDALLKSFHKIAKQLNKIVDTYDDIYPSLTDQKFGLEWWDMRDRLKEMSLQIPPLTGNDGEIHREEEDMEAMKRASNIHVDVEAPPTAPAHQAAPQKIGFATQPYVDPLEAGSISQPSAGVTEGDSDHDGLDWQVAQQQLFGAPAHPMGWQAQPQQAMGYQQPAPQSPWNSQPNYNSGYIPQAQRMAGATSQFGQPPSQTPPWVSTENPPYSATPHW